MNVIMLQTLSTYFLFHYPAEGLSQASVCINYQCQNRSISS